MSLRGPGRRKRLSHCLARAARPNLRAVHRRRKARRRPELRCFQSSQSPGAGTRGAGDGGRRRRGGQGRPRRVSSLEHVTRARPRALPVRARAADSKAQSAVRGARDARQRQTHPRVARPGRAAGRAPLRLSRRLGAAHGRAVAGVRADWRGRPDHPLELSAPDAGLESRASPGDGQHRHPEARRVHAAHGAAVCRDQPGRRLATGRAQRADRRR